MRRTLSSLEVMEPRELLSSATFALTSDWGTGFGGQVTIANTGSTPVTNWSLSFNWDRSITQIWDGTISRHVGNQYMITNAGWNATIAPGGTVAFGFDGTAGNVGSDVPTNYALDGVPLGASTPPGLSINNVTVNDGTAGATAAFTVSLSQAAATSVTVGYATAAGTATAGTDYTATSGILTFSPGSLTQTIDVPINPDSTAKSNLTFQVNLSSAVGATLATTSGTGTIVDTIPPTASSATASFEVTSDWGTGFGGQITLSNNGSTAINNWTLSFNWDRAITSIWDASIVRYTCNQYVITNAGWNAAIAPGGTATLGFNGSPGSVGNDVPTNYVLNGVVLGAGAPSLNISSVSVNDGSAGTTADFTVTLSQASTKTVTVNYATADGTAHAGTDYEAASGTLTFSPGTLSQSLSVTINPDTTAKANLTFQVNLSSPSGAGIATTSGVGTIVDTIGLPPTPPVANNVSTETVEGTAVTLNVLSDASDPNGYTLSLASYTQPGNGTVTKNSSGMLVYTPAASYLGADSFAYTVSDGHGETATGTVSMTVVAPTTASNWPSHVFAPYVDMTLYPTYNLVTAMQTAGIKYFTLAFITADSNNAPAWGGYSTYEVNGGSFDQSIRAQISQVRRLGGDVSVSFGGAAGLELAQAITNVNTLTAAYQQVITAYGLTHIDFDIEGAAVADTASIDRRSQAIAALQQAATASGKTLYVSFTLPVLPTGLDADGLYVLQSALKYGVKISTVNIMTMDFGDSTAPNPAGQMGTYAIDSAQSTHTQLQSLYGTTQTSSRLWEMIGVTPMIGVNDQSDEVFGFSDASQLLAFAQSVGMGEIGIWSLARDKQDPAGALTYAEPTSSSLVQSPYEFSDIFNAFTGT
ncbi:MAG: cellulose binding domain-containing protein [Thermoguttaceae bacterium]